LSINVELKEAWQYTTDLFTRLKELAVLIVVMCIPILDIAIAGYYTRILGAPSNAKTPPKLEGFSRLFLDGLKLAVVFIVWFIIVAIIINISGGLSMTWVGDPSEYVDSLVSILVFGVTMFVVSIFAVMSIVHMFKQESFVKAFAIKELLNKISQIGWAKYIVFLVCVYVTIYVLSLVMLLPISHGIFGMLINGVIVAALSVVPVILFARTISNLYDNTITQSENPPLPPPPPPI
jgi:hypothetical protein